MVCLADLDKFEGYTGTADNNLYIREKRTVLREDGKQQECWVYIYANKNMPKKKGYRCRTETGEDLYQDSYLSTQVNKYAYTIRILQ